LPFYNHHNQDSSNDDLHDRYQGGGARRVGVIVKEVGIFMIYVEVVSQVQGYLCGAGTSNGRYGHDKGASCTSATRYTFQHVLICPSYLTRRLSTHDP
jgi:hypothetical protein